MNSTHAVGVFVDCYDGVMAEPLPVDVAQTWWDYFKDGVGVLSGLATAVALVVAVVAYLKQAYDLRSEQARKMVIDSNFQLSQADQDDRLVLTDLWIRMDNLSDHPIFDVKTSPLERSRMARRRSYVRSQKGASNAAHASILGEPRKTYSAGMTYVPRITFRDSAGYHWDCDPDGRQTRIRE